MMKINRKPILTCLFIMSTMFSYSQVKLGIFGGPQLTSVKYEIEGETQPAQTKYGYQLGATIKVPFEDNLYFAPEIYYSLKGYNVTLNKTAFPPSQKAINNDTRIHTIETAAMLQYDLSAKPSHFFIKGGIAFDVAISGKEKYDILPKQTISRDMKFSFTEYGRITASANLRFGYEASNGLLIFAHYAHGIGSMNNSDYGPKILHRIAGISLGYYLHKKPKTKR